MGVIEKEVLYLKNSKRTMTLTGVPFKLRKLCQDGFGIFLFNRKNNKNVLTFIECCVYMNI